jgi:hypothetical protein
MIYSAFITVKYLKDNSPILAYVNDDELQVFIKPAQDIYLQKILGTKFYYSLMDKISTNSLNVNEIDLITQYIQPVVVWYTTMEFALYANYKFTNKSISKQNSDNSNPSELNEVNYVTTSLRQKAQYFGDRLTKHLMGETTTFPEYLEYYTNTFENIPSSRQNYYWGIYVPGGRFDDPQDCGGFGANPNNSWNINI